MSAPKRRAKPRQRRTDATPREVMACALAEATLTSDAIVAKQHGVSAATLRTWRARLADDRPLRALFTEERARVSFGWFRAASAAYVSLCQELRRRVSEDPAALDTLDLVGAIKILGESLVEAGTLLGAEAGLDAPSLGMPSPPSDQRRLDS